MKNFDVMRFSDIPALDGSLSLEEEAEYTEDSINDVIGGLVPPKWQRPSDRGRIDGINGIGAWLDGDAQRSMPDGILLGLNPNNHQNLAIEDNINFAIGGKRIKQVNISQTLNQGCPACGPYTDANGDPVYQNRCFDHACNHHSLTTAPLMIIDGQHRSLGLWKSTIDDKDVTASLLPIFPLDAGKTGYNQEAQAIVFEQVNSEAKKLTQNHELWLKRMFGNWAPQPGPANYSGQAYDLISKLGHTTLPLPVPSPWRGRIKLLHAPKAGCLIENPVFIVGEASGKIDGTGAFEAVMDALSIASDLSGLNVQTIASYWLDCWELRVAPARFAAGGLFEASARSFAALLRTMDLTLRKMMDDGVVNFTNVEFDAELLPYAPYFISANWEDFVEQGDESVQRNVYNLLAKILESPVGMPGPPWNTLPPAGPGWDDWIRYAPDPLAGFDPPTLLVGGDQPPGITPDLDPANPRAAIDDTDVITWESPWNIGHLVSARWRIGAGNWKIIQRFGSKVTVGNGVCSTNRLCEMELEDMGNLTNMLRDPAIAVGALWDLRLIYTTSGGTTTEIIIGFTKA
ncbi:hypothetical protein N9V76_02450 [Candidatus Poseidoniales archaeon]|nr:hypothetical protein [Candidatus Poseidoniales archaeon]